MFVKHYASNHIPDLRRESSLLNNSDGNKSEVNQPICLSEIFQIQDKVPH